MIRLRIVGPMTSEGIDDVLLLRKRNFFLRFPERELSYSLVDWAHMLYSMAAHRDLPSTVSEL